MTAGCAFIIGLMFCNAKLVIVGTDWGIIGDAIEEWYPEFFKEIPSGYEKYLNRINATELMEYLYNNAKTGSVVHMRAFINLYSMFVEELYVDDDDLRAFVRKNYRAFSYEELVIGSKYFSDDDRRFYLNRIYPMSERYK